MPTSPSQAPSPGGRVFAGFVVLGLCFAVLHVALHLTWFGPKLCGALGDAIGFVSGQRILEFTDVRSDFGPNTYLSVLAMIWAGVAAWQLTSSRPPNERKGWWWTGGLFVYLGIDDAFLIHERINDWARQFVGDDYSFPWIKVLLPFFAIAGLVVFVFLFRALRAHPRRRLEMVGGFGCLGAAVGFEILERFAKDAAWRPRGFGLVQYPVVPEEFLEVLGPALLLLCFVRLRKSP